MEMLHLVSSASLRKEKKRKKEKEKKKKIVNRTRYVQRHINPRYVHTSYVQTQKGTYPTQVNVNCILSAAVTSLL